MGKTALALNMAEHVAIDAGLPVGVFSMEMSASQLAMRLLGSIGKLDQHRLRTGRLGEDDWRRLGFLSATLRDVDLATGATTELLHKLFPEDDVRVFSSRPVRFHCRCSQSRVEEVLRMLGEDETRAALRERGQVDVTCEYCGRVRTFDPIDVSRVFSGQVLAGTNSLH